MRNIDQDRKSEQQDLRHWLKVASSKCEDQVIALRAGRKRMDFKFDGLEDYSIRISNFKELRWNCCVAIQSVLNIT